MDMNNNISIERKKRALEIGLRNFKNREDVSEVNKILVSGFIDNLYLQNYSVSRNYYIYVISLR